MMSGAVAWREACKRPRRQAAEKDPPKDEYHFLAQGGCGTAASTSFITVAALLPV
jgi:hypothetical protein